MNIKYTILAFLRKARTNYKVFVSRNTLKHGRDLHIGARSRIWATEFVEIGDYVYLGKDVHIEANCKIGDYSMLANRVAIVGRHDHDIHEIGCPVRFSPWIGSKRTPSKYKNECAIVEDDVWVGFGSIILTGVTIGRGCVIAAGSVVSKDIPPYAIAAGVPAKVVGKRFENQETINKHEEIIKTSKYYLSERGYDFYKIEQNVKNI
jgi:acetyltransferase-like isoleucine patch superfamily enzyme